MKGLSSSPKRLEITDATLCAIHKNKMNSRYIRSFYKAVLHLGIDYVQVPVQALEAIGDAVSPARTVLKVSPDMENIPKGFAGYVGAVSGMPYPCVCETVLGGVPSFVAKKNRYLADDTLFRQEYAGIFSELVKEPGASFCTRGAKALGTALMVEWVLAGGQKIVASMLGAGGYAPLEEVLAALYVTGYLPDTVRLQELSHVASLYENLAGETILTHKAVVGKNLFDVESGVHVDGMVKNKISYEPFPPEAVGTTRRIAIGKHSGRRALLHKLQELGFTGFCDVDRLLILVRKKSMELQSELDDATFVDLVQRALGDDAA